jgi:DNA-binding NtrC family response regulator
VLIVDDCPEVLAAIRHLTVRAGWSVQTATSLMEAVVAASQHPLDLLLTDVVMPNGDGPAVRDAVHAIQPNLPTIFMTGYADSRLKLDSGAITLKKPFSWDELNAAIQIVTFNAEQSTA